MNKYIPVLFTSIGGILLGHGLTTLAIKDKEPTKQPVYNYRIHLQRGDAPIAIAIPIEDYQLAFFETVGTNKPVLGKIELEKINK